METIALAAAGTWIGAIGIGLIRIGWKLNNTVQRLTVVVNALGGEVQQHRRDIRAIRAAAALQAERLSVLEANSK